MVIRTGSACRLLSTHRRVRVCQTVALLMVCGAALVGAQTRAGQAAGGSALRTTWGEPDLTGVWGGVDLTARPGKDALNLAQLERLYKADARPKELSAKDDPGLKCLPQAFPRAALLGQPIQIVQRPGLLIVLTEAFHTFRTIPTDNRSHPKDFLFPMYLGDSTGRWENDTLVVDVTSFNGQSWLANATDKPAASSRGVWPTSDVLHVVERWRRTGADTLQYEATVDDPATLTGQWTTPKIVFKRQMRNRIDVGKCFVNEPATVPPKVAAAR
jgi:hypothetical protein